jgi:hypothetical protein
MLECPPPLERLAAGGSNSPRPTRKDIHPASEDVGDRRHEVDVEDKRIAA